MLGFLGVTDRFDPSRPTEPSSSAGPGLPDALLQSEPLPPLRVKTPGIRLLGAAGVLFFVGAAFLLAWVGRTELVLLSALMAALSLDLYLGHGPIEVDSRRIRKRCGFASHEILWGEVDFVETDSLFRMLVFTGKDELGRTKRLPILGAESWSGEDSEDLLAFVVWRIETLGIPYRRRERALLKRPKGTRAKG